MSLGRSLYIATYLGSCKPKALFLIKMQKSDTSLSVAESPVPLSIESMPDIYLFLYLLYLVCLWCCYLFCIFVFLFFFIMF